MVSSLSCGGGGVVRAGLVGAGRFVWPVRGFLVGRGPGGNVGRGFGGRGRGRTTRTMRPARQAPT